MLLFDLHSHPGSPGRYLYQLDPGLPGKDISLKESGRIIHVQSVSLQGEKGLCPLTKNILKNAGFKIDFEICKRDILVNR
jgi:hypothetical protein